MREPFGRRVRKRIAPRLSKGRNNVSKKVRSSAPSFPDRNLGEGVFIGAVGSAVATILEDTVGLPFGASVNIIDVEASDGFNIYTVDVNAPTENMAEAKAFIESGSGFISYLTDSYEIDDAEVLTSRMARDTYRVRVRVETVK